jgi:hypothetical protein
MLLRGLPGTCECVLLQQLRINGDVVRDFVLIEQNSVQGTGIESYLYLIIKEEAFPWFGPLLYALVHRKVRLRSLGFIWARVRI